MKWIFINFINFKNIIFNWFKTYNMNNSKYYKDDLIMGQLNDYNNNESKINDQPMKL